MAEENKELEQDEKKVKPQPSPALGARAEPTVLSDATKIDIDTKKILVDSIIEAGLSSTLDTGELDKFTSIANTRDQVYQLIDIMCLDSSVSAIVRTLATDVCAPADSGHVMWAEASDPKISKYINYILNTINVDKNMYAWAYSLIKYGDIYLKLYRESDYEDELFVRDKVEKAYRAKNVLNESLRREMQDLDESINLAIHTATDNYSGYIEMVADPCTMFELDKFGQTMGFIETPNAPAGMDYLNTFAGDITAIASATSTAMYRMKTDIVNIYQADDYVHAMLEDDANRYPETVSLFRNDEELKTGCNPHLYEVKRGKSLLYDAYKIWREKSLLEASALLNRITRSSVIRPISIEVGDMSKEQTQQILRRVKEMFEQKTSYSSGTSMSEYTNPGPIENNVYFATHNGQGAINIQSVGGDFDPKQLTDLDWWNNKFYSSFGIPKQYFGWTDDGAGFNGGTSLSIISSVYANSVKRVQNALIQAITDAVNLFLIQRGYVSYLNNFTIKMRAPITQEETDYRAGLTNRINAISSLNSLFTDVDSKPTRLAILKNLVATLDLGDEILASIDEEIKEQKEKAKKEAEQAELEAQQAAEGGDDLGDLDLGDLDGGDEGGGDDADLNLDMDLGDLPDAQESFTSNGGSLVLTETEEVDTEGQDQLTETATLVLTEDEDNLPSPDDLGDDIDFTKNN